MASRNTVADGPIGSRTRYAQGCITHTDPPSLASSRPQPHGPASPNLSPNVNTLRRPDLAPNKRRCLHADNEVDVDGKRSSNHDNTEDHDAFGTNDDDKQGARRDDAIAIAMANVFATTDLANASAVCRSWRAMVDRDDGAAWRAALARERPATAAALAEADARMNNENTRGTVAPQTAPATTTSSPSLSAPRTQPREQQQAAGPSAPPPTARRRDSLSARIVRGMHQSLQQGLPFGGDKIGTPLGTTPRLRVDDLFLVVELWQDADDAAHGRNRIAELATTQLRALLGTGAAPAGLTNVRERRRAEAEEMEGDESQDDDENEVGVQPPNVNNDLPDPDDVDHEDYENIPRRSAPPGWYPTDSSSAPDAGGLSFRLSPNAIIGQSPTTSRFDQAAPAAAAADAAAATAAAAANHDDRVGSSEGRGNGFLGFPVPPGVAAEAVRPQRAGLRLYARNPLYVDAAHASQPQHVGGESGHGDEGGVADVVEADNNNDDNDNNNDAAAATATAADDDNSNGNENTARLLASEVADEVRRGLRQLTNDLLSGLDSSDSEEHDNSGGNNVPTSIEEEDDEDEDVEDEENEGVVVGDDDDFVPRRRNANNETLSYRTRWTSRSASERALYGMASPVDYALGQMLDLEAEGQLSLVAHLVDRSTGKSVLIMDAAVNEVCPTYDWVSTNRRGDGLTDSDDDNEMLRSINEGTSSFELRNPGRCEVDFVSDLFPASNGSLSSVIGWALLGMRQYQAVSFWVTMHVRCDDSGGGGEDDCEGDEEAHDDVPPSGGRNHSHRHGQRRPSETIQPELSPGWLPRLTSYWSNQSNAEGDGDGARQVRADVSAFKRTKLIPFAVDSLQMRFVHGTAEETLPNVVFTNSEDLLLYLESLHWKGDADDADDGAEINQFQTVSHGIRHWNYR